MEEYHSNSDRSRVENTSPLPQGSPQSSVTRRKKSVVKRILASLIADDVGNIGDHFIFDVLIPKLKRMCYDAICDGAGMFLDQKNGRTNVPAGHVSYRNYYNNPRDTNREQKTTERRYYDDLLFNDRGDAEVVLARMRETIRDRDAVSVAEFFDYAGEPSDYTSHKFGWTNLDNACVRMTHGGKYIIQLPKPTVL